jgi:hypothetical protein
LQVSTEATANTCTISPSGIRINIRCEPTGFVHSLGFCLFLGVS